MAVEPIIKIEDDRTGMDQAVVRRAFLDNLVSLQGKSQHASTARDRFFALAYTVRDRLFHRWIQTQEAYYKADAKRIYYLSAEFLIGRSLATNLLNLGLMERARQALDPLGIRLGDLLEEEVDAGLGNGGLGRLAACFLDSMATRALPGYGYGIRYEFGIFNQVIRHGHQVERPDEWLRFGNPWEVARPEYAFPVRFGGRTERVAKPDGSWRVRWVDGTSVLGIPYDTPIAGYGNDTVNTLRLWRARASEEFDLEVFNAGDYVRAVDEKNQSENISRVLYPVDHSPQGKELRLKQQYFFVACSVADIVRRYALTHRDFSQLADKIAIQLNDTHPAIAIAELMRLLVDEHDLGWDEAWQQTRRACAYTNHTILSEALEKWPVALFERLLPRHLEIIYEINARFLREVRNRHPLDEQIASRMSIIEESPVKSVRMANLAIVGTHATNGVAALHTHILKQRIFPDFAAMWPERFQNKTNGVTPRRWILEANPGLAALITEAIGPSWVVTLDELVGLEKLATDASFQEKFRAIKRANKTRLGVREDAMLAVQVKRFHEYKRQLLNVLHVIALWRRIRDGRAAGGPPRTVLLGGKAAPGYTMAKLHIKLIHAVASVVNKDVPDRLRVVFSPNYRVSSAQNIIPAADVSEQISTAGYEASGTGNMKLGLNGALTVGTLDGANVEIREAVGAENFFLFGLDADGVTARKAAGYRPRDVLAADPELAEVLLLLERDFFAPEEPGLFRPIVDSLMNEDRYLVLADFAEYARCQERVGQAFLDEKSWTERAILNVARLGRFSSDRTIAEYNEKIWGSKPVPVVIEPYRPID